VTNEDLGISIQLIRICLLSP